MSRRAPNSTGPGATGRYLKMRTMIVVRITVVWYVKMRTMIVVRMTVVWYLKMRTMIVKCVSQWCGADLVAVMHQGGAGADGAAPTHYPAGQIVEVFEVSPLAVKLFSRAPVCFAWRTTKEVYRGRDNESTGHGLLRCDRLWKSRGGGRAPSTAGSRWWTRTVCRGTLPSHLQPL
jgi:hypothetical protein